MIEPRIYRAAFLPALLAVVLAMFSFESRPAPLSQGLAADVLFDGRLAAQSAATIAAEHPDRRPGTAGDRATGETVARTLGRRGFRVARDHFTHAGRDLMNVVARRAGRSRRQIVVLAPRDAIAVPDATASAADTAALLELSRVFAGRPSRKTLVLASVDGSNLGEVGTQRLADQLGDPGLVDGVIAISNLGAGERGGSLIVPWSDDSTRAGIGLQRTVADSIRQEIDAPVGGAGTAGQLVRLGFPVGIGAQGVLIERGFQSVRISGSGERPPGGTGPIDRIDEDRLGGLGRAALRSVTALDQGPSAERGPRTYVVAVSQVVPGWALSLLGLALLLPALVASVDAFARARRRREPVGPWLQGLAFWVAPALAALLLVEVLALVGATPDPPPAPVAPRALPLDGPAMAVLAGAAVVAGLAWWGARALSFRSRPGLRDPRAPGAACAASLAVCVAVLVLWTVNPFAALFLVPAAHLWMLAVLPDPHPPRRVRALLVAAGALPPAIAGVYYLLALHLDPLSGAWYLLMLVSGGAVGPLAALLACVLLGALGAVAAIVRAGRREQPGAPDARDRPPLYGPGAYAGPGSLGGTESALRR